MSDKIQLSLAGLQQGFLQKQAELQKQALDPWRGALIGGGIGGLGGGGLGYLLGDSWKSTLGGALAGGAGGAGLGYGLAARPFVRELEEIKPKYEKGKPILELVAKKKKALDEILEIAKQYKGKAVRNIPKEAIKRYKALIGQIAPRELGLEFIEQIYPGVLEKIKE